jgi:hypothetical protein
MKTKIIILLLLILVVGCYKDKSDTRKMVGIWKRIQVNFISGSSTVLDTVVFTKNQFTSKYGNYTYYLANDSLFLISNTTDTSFYSYKITDENSFRLDSWFLQDGYFQLTKIN